MSPQSVLLVEDDANLNKMLRELLERRGCDVTAVTTACKARAALAGGRLDLILLDMRLPDADGLDLLPEFALQAPVIAMTAFGGRADHAMRAVRAGASDYLQKPFTPEALDLAVTRLFTTAELKRDVAFLEAQAERTRNSALVGDSPEMTELRRLIELYATSDSSILIEGESGTGKELVARALHEASAQAGGRFVPIDCEPGDEGSFASELFGHEPGAFPGAEQAREGMLEYADGGALYISDIAEMSPAMQSRFLRVLEKGTFRRLGGKEDIATSARIIAGTSVDLHHLVTENGFRSELYFRLSAFRLHVPALRDRRSDIQTLARFFLERRSFRKGVEKTLAPETFAALEQYDWPGNVRELRNAIERGVILSGAEAVILPRHLTIGSDMQTDPHRGLDGPAQVALRFAQEPTMDELRAAYLQFLIKRHDGNRRVIAEIMGVSERNMYRLIQKLGLET